MKLSFHTLGILRFFDPQAEKVFREYIVTNKDTCTESKDNPIEFDIQFEAEYNAVNDKITGGLVAVSGISKR